MPKPGYTRIIVRIDIRDQLKKLAEAQGYRTINQLLKAWLKIYLEMHPTTIKGIIGHAETNPKIGLLQKTALKSWWAGLD